MAVILVAVVLFMGIVLGTVPIGGRTIAQRILALFPPSLPMPGRSLERPSSAPRTASGRSGPKPEPKPEPRRAESTATPKAPPSPPAGDVTTAGEANSPDRRSDSDKAALERLLARPPGH